MVYKIATNFDLKDDCNHNITDGDGDDADDVTVLRHCHIGRFISPIWSVSLP